GRTGQEPEGPDRQRRLRQRFVGLEVARDTSDTPPFDRQSVADSRYLPGTPQQRVALRSSLRRKNCWPARITATSWWLGAPSTGRKFVSSRTSRSPAAPSCPTTRFGCSRSTANRRQNGHQPA